MKEEVEEEEKEEENTTNNASSMMEHAVPDMISPIDTLSSSSSSSSSIADKQQQQQQQQDEEEFISTQEAVQVVLSFSEEATVAAEAKLTPKEADVGLPLIPSSSSSSSSSSRFNDTFGKTVVLMDEEPLVVVPSIIPACQVVGEPFTAIPPPPTAVFMETPNVKKIVSFAIPAIGVWLCGPLLSLIDTSAVGLFSGTVQQAALNPAVAVTDYAALLIAFMYTATTNLVAAARETDRGVEGKPRSTQNFVSALQLSGFVGAGLGALLLIFAQTLLRAIIGNDGMHPQVLTAAIKYVRIRALGMPAAVVIGSSQAACLGMQDIKSPLYVLLAAAVINLFGDILFVRSTNPILGGAAGAAWATVLSQYAAAFFFLKWLCHHHQPKQQQQQQTAKQVVNVSKAILELTGNAKSQGASRRKKLRADLKRLAKNVTGRSNPVTSKIVSFQQRLAASTKKNTKVKSESFSTRGFLCGKFHPSDFLRLPSREDLSHFVPYVVPVTTTQVGRVSSYVAMSHVVSSSLGTMSMAAQQVILSFFYCLTPIADSLSLTAQSFVPAISEKKVSLARAAALRTTAFSFLKAGAVFGSVMVAAVGAMPLLSRFFTSDPAVMVLVNSVVPWLMGFFVVHGVCIAAEGMLLGQKDLSFLGKAYAGYFVAVPYLMLRLKRTALLQSSSSSSSGVIGSTTTAVGLTSLWKLFFAYNAFRTVAWVGRTALLQVRTQRQAMLAEEASSF